MFQHKGALGAYHYDDGDIPKAAAEGNRTSYLPPINKDGTCPKDYFLGTVKGQSYCLPHASSALGQEWDWQDFRSATAYCRGNDWRCLEKEMNDAGKNGKGTWETESKYMDYFSYDNYTFGGSLATDLSNTTDGNLALHTQNDCIQEGGIWWKDTSDEYKKYVNGVWANVSDDPLTGYGGTCLIKKGKPPPVIEARRITDEATCKNKGYNWNARYDGQGCTYKVNSPPVGWWGMIVQFFDDFIWSFEHWRIVAIGGVVFYVWVNKN